MPYMLISIVTLNGYWGEFVTKPFLYGIYETEELAEKRKQMLIGENNLYKEYGYVKELDRHDFVIEEIEINKDVEIDLINI